jgi:hypothetical protein
MSDSMKERQFLDSPTLEELSEAGVKIRPGCDPASREFDLLERYLSIPNHAMFLYTSEDTLVEKYIRDHWAALDGLSGEICDIHVSLIQLLGGADAYSQFDEIRSIPGLETMNAQDLPSIHIWSQNASLRVLLAPFQDEEALKSVLRLIFSELRSNKLPLSESQAIELKSKVLSCLASLPKAYQQILDASAGRDIVQITNNYFGKNAIMNNNAGDTYNVGQAGAVGRNASSDNNKFFQSEQKQTLAEAAEEIQKLLKQLEHSNPSATEVEKIAYVDDETTPSFKRRVVSALKAGGESAIEEFLDNPYVNVGKAVIKGWFQPE